MKRIGLVLLLASLAAVSPAQELNRMGLFFSDTDFSSGTTNFTVTPGVPFDAWIVLLDPEASSIDAYEVRIEISDSTVFVLGASGPNGWTNFGSSTNHIVEYSTPVPAVAGAAVLGQLQLLLSGTDLVELSFDAAVPSSFDGQYPGYVDGSALIPCILSTGGMPPGVVATLNGPGVDVDGWSTAVDVQIDLYVDGDTVCRAATDSLATLGHDEGLEVPAAAGSRIHFPHPEWGVPGVEDFDVEYQPSLDPTEEVRTWTFEVVTELADPYQPEQVQIAFMPDFDQSDGLGVYLVDRTAGITLPVLEYLEYNYLVSTSETRTFDLMVGQVDVTDRIEVGVAGYVDGLRDLDNVARTLPGATDGWDEVIDVPEPAPVPGDYVNVTFHHLDWPLGPRFRADTAALYDYGNVEKVWPLRIETDHAGPVTLVFWPNFHVNDGIGLELRDPANSEIFDLHPDHLVEVDMSGAVRDLELAIGGPSYPSLEPDTRAMPASWAMIGLPLQPDPGSTLDDVVLADSPGSTFVYQLDELGDYVEVDPSASADRAVGYWVGSTEPFTWDAYGDYGLAPITATLHEGWNLVGNPIWFPASLAGVQVIDGAATLDWDDAVAADLVSPSVYAYDPNAQAYVPATSLQAWQGHYVRALEPDLALLFDHEVMEQAPPLPEVGGEEDLPDALDWKLDLTLRADAGPLGMLRLGVDPDATAGFDNRHDRPAPPRTPAGTEPLLFATRPDRDPAFGTRFRQDLTSPDASPFSWHVVLEAAAPGMHNLSWHRRDWPAGHDLQLYRPDQNRVIVMSMREVDQCEILLGDDPLLIEVRTPSNAIGVADLAPVPDQLRAAPNPFNPLTVLTFDLTRGGEASVSIYNARGQLVDRLDLGARSAGHHEVTWRARDHGGRTLPSATYFGVLERDGRQIGEVVKLSLVR